MGRFWRRGIVALTALGVGLLLVGASAGAAGPPFIHASTTNNWINLHDWTPGSAVTVTVGSYSAVVTVDSGGFASIPGHVHGQDLDAGNTITAVGTGESEDLTLASASITAIDHVADTISGTAPAGADLNVTLSGFPGNFAGTADVNGNWTIDTTGLADFGPGTHVQLHVPDADGDNTVVEYFPPQVNASLNHDWVSLDRFAPGSAVDVAVGPYAETVTTDASGRAFLDRQRHGQDLVSGVLITATGPSLEGRVTKSLTLDTLSIDTVDTGTNVVSGTAAGDANVGLGINDGPTHLGGTNTTADSAGAWSVDLSSIVDLDLGHSVHASVGDGDSDFTTFNYEPPSITGGLRGDWINLHGWPAGSGIDVTVGGATFPVTADAMGNASIDRSVHGTDLVAGTVITATDGMTLKSLTLLDVTFDSLDAAADVARGTAPADAPVHVNLNDGRLHLGSVNTVADSAGDWVADFSGIADVEDATFGSAGVRDDDGDQTAAEWQLPSINASLTNDWINFHQWPAGATIAVTIDGATFTVIADAFGNAHLDRSVHGRDLVPGSVITATDGTTPKSLTMAALAYDLDPATNVAAGMAPAGALLDLDLNDGPAHLDHRQLTADPSGNWSFDYTTIGIDVVLGMGGSVRMSDADGDSTTADEFLHVPVVNASLTGDGINLHQWPAGATVAVTIDGGAPFAVVVDGAGNGHLQPDAHGHDLVAGTVITASDGGATKTLTLAALTFDTLDPATDVAAGTAPAGAVLHLNLNDGPTHVDNREVTAAADGSWSFDYSTVGIDVDLGTGANVFLHDEDGDGTGADKFLPVPVVNASLSGDGINLHQWPAGATVAVTIDGGTPFAVVVDGTGNGHLQPDVHGVDLVAGKVVEASHGGVTKTLTLAALTFDTLDPATDVAAGTAPAGAVLHLNLNDGPTHVDNRQVTVAVDGTWSFDYSTVGIDVVLGMGGNVFHSDDDGDGTGADKFLQVPVVNASLTWDGINLHQWPAGATVDVTIDGGAPFAVAVDATGNGELRPDVHGHDLVAGTVVTASHGDVTKTLTLAALSFDTLDPDTDVAAGTAPPDAQLNLNFHDQDGNHLASVQETADSAGNWSVDLTGTVDVALGTGGSVFLHDDDGDGTGADKFVHVPVVNASLTWNGINLHQWPAGATVDVTIDGGAPFAVPVDGDGNGELQPDVHGQDIVAGTIVEASHGGVTKTLTLTALTFDVFDPATDEAAGTGPAGAELQLNVNEGPNHLTNQQVTVGPDGNWSFDFTGIVDIERGMGGSAFHFDEDGDGTVADKFLDIPSVHAALEWNGIDGWGFTPSSTVAVAIRSTPGAEPPLYENAAVPTNGDGAFTLEPQQHGVDLVPGMEITVTGSTKVLVLVDVDVGAIDVAADTVSGTAPANAQVDVGFFGPNGEHNVSVAADGTGNWTANVAYDIVGRTDVHASVPDDDGDRTSTSARTPGLDASLPSDQIWLHGFGFDTVTISDAGGTVLFSGPPQPFCNCLGPEVHGVDLVPGMNVSATDGTNTLELTLAEVTIDSVDVGSGLVTGTAPAGADVELSVGGPFESFVTVAADGVTGAWTADLSGSGLSAFQRVFAGVPDAEGERTFAERQPPAIDGDLVLDSVNGCGFAPASNVTVSIGGVDAGSAPTDADGCFGFDATAQDLAAGKTVTVADATTTRELLLAPLTIEVDYATDTVSGTAAPGESVDVTAQGQEWGDSQTVAADSSGNWSAPFDIDLSLVELRAHVDEPDGDRTTATQSADLRWGDTSFFVPENAGSVELTVRRIGATHVVVGADYATTDGTATAGADYTAASGTLTFAEGAAIQTFTVAIADDADVEGDETIQLTLSNPTGGAALAAPVATLTITDDDSVQDATVTAGDTATVSEDPESGQVTVVMSAPDPSPLTITATPNCSGGATPVSVTLTLGTYSTPMTDPDADGVYSATIPAGEVEDGELAITVECPDASAYVSTIGEVVLYDPSGIVSDATTGDPIEGAEVTLYKVPSWVPNEDGVLEEGECQTGGGPWTQPAPIDLGVRVEPLGNPEIEPDTNPQFTNAEGRYGWDVARGCWFIVVSKAGYVTQTSPVVGVPPAVTDLHIALVPIPDDAAPVLTVPSGVEVNATSPDGAVVTYEASAADAVDPEPVLVCEPPSESLFAIGDTTVTCTATDAAGNSAEASFDVHVKGAAEQLADLSAAVADLGLAAGTEQSLREKVDQAMASHERGNVTAACGQLAAFADHVEAQRGKEVPEAAADALLEDVARLQAVMVC